MEPSAFARFAAIDWSGAVGPRQRGIAIALCGLGGEAPRLVRPGHVWSRAEALAWMLEEMPGRTLVGLDLGPSLPFADRGAFFPGWARSPPDARGLWRLVEEICAEDPHLAASSFVDHPDAARHFRRHGGRVGDRFQPGRGRLRVTEEAQRAQGLNPYSNFNLVGAAQVGKSSLTGMRLLRRLDGKLPVWPFDFAPDRPFDPQVGKGSLVVEIYTSIAALRAGLPKGRTKVRDPATLDRALAALGSAPHRPLASYNDHATDAIMSAAWLRLVHGEPALWAPPALTPVLARTEGWTFGVR
ncbi:MAG: hypothetical protein ACK4K7_03220 [Allosphingosinicella sp.]|uniref:hypothetical protein n=1 Tax=Allosphingosinicella sp. TaxID=2823234 RepID=UPI00393F030D